MGGVWRSLKMPALDILKYFVIFLEIIGIWWLVLLRIPNISPDTEYNFKKTNKGFSSYIFLTGYIQICVPTPSSPQLVSVSIVGEVVPSWLYTVSINKPDSPEFISKWALIRSVYSQRVLLQASSNTREKQDEYDSSLCTRDIQLHMQMAQLGRTKDDNNKITPKPQILRRQNDWMPTFLLGQEKKDDPQWLGKGEIINPLCIKKNFS